MHKYIKYIKTKIEAGTLEHIFVNNCKKQILINKNYKNNKNYFPFKILVLSFKKIILGFKNAQLRFQRFHRENLTFFLFLLVPDKNLDEVLCVCVFRPL